MKLHKDYLTGELGLPSTAIKDTVIGTRRWSEDHEIIFIFEGKYYRTYYSQGLTESQGESPFEYSPEEIECEEVELVEKLVKIWQTKK